MFDNDYNLHGPITTITRKQFDILEKMIIELSTNATFEIECGIFTWFYDAKVGQVNYTLAKNSSGTREIWISNHIGCLSYIVDDNKDIIVYYHD